MLVILRNMDYSRQNLNLIKSFKNNIIVELKNNDSLYVVSNANTISGKKYILDRLDLCIGQRQLDPVMLVLTHEELCDVLKNIKPYKYSPDNKVIYYID